MVLQGSVRKVWICNPQKPYKAHSNPRPEMLNPTPCRAMDSQGAELARPISGGSRVPGSLKPGARVSGCLSDFGFAVSGIGSRV